MPEQPINAGAKPATEGLCLLPGRILRQAPRLVVQLRNGTIRPLTHSEAAAFKRWNRL